jgi:hypothetical protein
MRERGLSRAHCGYPCFQPSTGARFSPIRLVMPARPLLHRSGSGMANRFMRSAASSLHVADLVRFLAMMPEPTTVATSRPVPRPSARSRVVRRGAIATRSGAAAGARHRGGALKVGDDPQRLGQGRPVHGFEREPQERGYPRLQLPVAWAKPKQQNPPWGRALRSAGSAEREVGVAALLSHKIREASLRSLAQFADAISTLPRRRSGRPRRSLQ